MPRPSSKAEKIRLNLEVSAPVRERLESLRARTGAESVTEVIRRALALYDTIVTASADRDSTLILKDADGSERQLIVT
jgi:hypothetical protein